jgi:AcrR family transcriptional regulator
MSLDPAGLCILDAAKSCCERWGLAKVTIEDIANEAGVSRATLYPYFPAAKTRRLVDAYQFLRSKYWKRLQEPSL